MISHPRLTDRVPVRRIAHGVVVFCALVAWIPASDLVSTAQAVTRDELSAWIEQLDSDQFTIRENAMARLVESGGAAIEPLSAAVPNGSLEMQIRGVHVLRQLALSDDESIALQAESALIDIADQSKGALGKQSKSAVNALGKVRQTAAIQRLESKGAVIQKVSSVSNGRRIIVPDRVEIGANWRGNRDDLADLKRLIDLPKLLLQGDQIGAQQLELLSSMTSLDWLSIKRAPISNQALVTLKSVKQITKLDIMYCEIDDDAVDSIKQLSNLTHISLFGTNLTPTGLEQLNKQMPHLSIDYRRGGYLGVACTTENQMCVVSKVENGSPAHRHGFQIDDVVTHFGGRELHGVEDLVKFAGMHVVGEEIGVRIMRAGTEVRITMKLGEWPLKGTEK